MVYVEVLTRVPHGPSHLCMENVIPRLGIRLPVILLGVGDPS